MLKMSSCPSRFCRRETATLSITDSKTCTSCERFTPRESNAPLRIRFSTARLFISVQSSMRWQKSWKDVKGPSLSRLAVSNCINPRPMFLMATNPKRMFSPSTVKPSKEWLMSGGRTPMPQSRHSAIYSATLSELCSTEVSRAAMYSLV